MTSVLAAATRRACTALICAASISMATAAAGTSEEEFWLDDERSAAEVNEGDLRFLDTPIDNQVLHSDNSIVITADSLSSGWVALTQCHHNIDPVPKVEIVYRYEAIRDLQIVSSKAIGKASIEGQSVQMEDVTQGASICVSAMIGNFYRQPDGKRYLLKNGPFMRKFLDGYYPYQVGLTVEYPDSLLSLTGIEPSSQPGFTIEAEPGKVSLRAWFEGRLFTRIHFDACCDFRTAAIRP